MTKWICASFFLLFICFCFVVRDLIIREGGLGQQFYKYPQNKQSPLNSDGQQFQISTKQRKSKQWWSTILQISTKQTITSHQVNMCKFFFIVHLFLFCRSRSNYQRGGFGIPLTGLTCHFFVPVRSRHGLFCFQWFKARGDCLFCGYLWNCWPSVLSFLFYVQWVKVRGDCLFCWYWWNCWPSLFKLSFIISIVD
jgi:hypothetical protein